MQALYDSDKGIGLNIYRYNLGAGSKNDTHILNENRRTECFLNADGTYNFNNDKNAQACLELAKKYAEDASPSFINGVLASIIKQNDIKGE